MRRFLCIGIAALIALAPWRGIRADEVDLELVLAVDVSSSIDDSEFELQRRGYTEAFANPLVVGAIRAGVRGKIAVAYVEWAGVESQALVVPWTVVGDQESAALLAEEIAAAPRPFRGWTSVSGAIDFSMLVLEASPHAGARRAIDVSSDGINNSGRPAAAARDAAVAAGITINGLVIMNDASGALAIWHPAQPLDRFFRDEVIGGPDAFVVAVDDFAGFAQAIRNKLIREIAELRRDR